MSNKVLRRLRKKLEEAEVTGEQPTIVGRVKSFGSITKIAERVISNQLDPFANRYNDLGLVPPLYDPAALCQMSMTCDVIAQCVKAMQVNINGMGYHLEYVPPDDQPDKQEDENDKAEKRKLEFLFQYPNAGETWSAIKDKILADKLLTGSGYLEVVRNLKDEIAELHHAQAKTIRMTSPDANPTEHIQWVRDGNAWRQIIRLTRFRRYCQIVGGEKMWFKQFGDPRSLNKNTGKFADLGARWPAELEATELITFGQDSPNTPYGEPPWVSELINIMGSSEAKKINYLYFNEKTIPPFIITVAGGTLGEDAVQELQDFLAKDFKGADNFHKVLLLEAESSSTGVVGDEKGPAVKIEVKPMTQFMQEDALFQQYIKNNAKAVRESFRLPPLLVGASEDYSHASTHESKVVAEQQVFAPERNELDEEINRTIIADFGTRSYRMRSHGTPISDDTQIVAALGVMLDVMPVGHAVDFISDLMGKEPPQLDPETRNMSVAEYRAKFRPAFDPFGLGLGPDDEPQQKHLTELLKGIRQKLQKRHNPPVA